MSNRNAILFHYCSNETFLSIAKTKTIWLSSLSLSNDSMEGRLVKSALMRVAEGDKLDFHSRERLRESLEFTERFFDGLGFCLSEQADLLSQWRGYADDGREVSIGFELAYLEELAQTTAKSESPGFALHKVEYEAGRHEALIYPAYKELRSLISAGAFRNKGLQSLLDTRTPEQITQEDLNIGRANISLIQKLLELLPMLFALKTSAFREEAEWRLVSMLGGKVFGDCLFRTCRSMIVPYRAFKLLPLARPAIAEVVLGPKNETPAIVVQSMLEQAGFTHTTVRHSTATYR